MSRKDSLLLNFRFRYILGCFISRILNQSDPRKEEYSPQNSKSQDLLDIIGVPFFGQEIYTCQYQPRYSKQCKYYTKGSFFHKNV